MKDQWDIYDALGAVPARTRTWKSSLRPRTAPARSGEAGLFRSEVCKPLTRNAARSSRVQIVFVLEQVLNGLLVGAYFLLIALGLR